MLPLLVGDLVPSDDPYWQLFLLLLKITDIVMAPKSTPAIAAYLRQLIEEHHTKFVHLYPDRSLTPKLHYLVHMPNWILRYVNKQCCIESYISNKLCHLLMNTAVAL